MRHQQTSTSTGHRPERAQARACLIIFSSVEQPSAGSQERATQDSFVPTCHHESTTGPVLHSKLLSASLKTEARKGRAGQDPSKVSIFRAVPMLPKASGGGRDVTGEGQPGVLGTPKLCAAIPSTCWASGQPARGKLTLEEGPQCCPDWEIRGNCLPWQSFRASGHCQRGLPESRSIFSGAQAAGTSK